MSLWCLQMCYEDLKALHKIFGGTTKTCENKYVSNFFCSSGIGIGRVNVELVFVCGARTFLI